MHNSDPCKLLLWNYISLFYLSVCCALLFDVGVWGSAHTRTHTLSHTQTGSHTHCYFYTAPVRGAGGEGRGGEERESLTQISPPFAGGLYGWEWGVFPAAGIAPTVPPKVSQDQPEGRATDHHRHRRPLSYRQAARSTGIPYGQSYALTLSVQPLLCHSPSMTVGVPIPHLSG